MLKGQRVSSLSVELSINMYRKEDVLILHDVKRTI